MQQSLFEQYRPSTWSDVIGQDKIVARIDALRKRGLTGRAYWLSGASGTGKTTIARLIAREVADDFMIREVDAAGLTVGDLQELEREMAVYGWGATKNGRAFLINEAHALRKPVIRQLLVLLERIPSHVAIVFTTTSEGQESLFEDFDDAGPLLSRCVRLDLARRDLAKPFAERLRTIAAAEGFGDIAPAVALKAVQLRFNNFRSVLQALESGELSA